MTSLVEIYRRWPTREACIEHLEAVRWQGKPVCTFCGGTTVARHREPSRERWQCWACNKSFSVTVGTIFHHTHIDLRRWFLLISLMLNAKKGLSSMQAARDIGIRQPTVWLMMHRIRQAMVDDRGLLAGIAEMDETYVGGKPRKANRRSDDPPGTPGVTAKLPIVGIVERGPDLPASEIGLAELRPPPEHAGTELHWIQAEGDDPDIGAWDASWPGQPRWRIFDSEASAVTGQEMAARGYHYLGPAEWLGEPRDEWDYGQRLRRATDHMIQASANRIAELEAQVKGGVAAFVSVCKADDRTFAVYQARIEELETENARLNAYIGKITDDNTALAAKVERLEDERDGWADVPADVRRKAARRDPPAVGRAPLPRKAMR